MYIFNIAYTICTNEGVVDMSDMYVDIFIISCIHTFRAGRIDQFPYIVDFRSAWWLQCGYHIYVLLRSKQTGSRVFFFPCRAQRGRQIILNNKKLYL